MTLPAPKTEHVSTHATPCLAVPTPIVNPKNTQPGADVIPDTSKASTASASPCAKDSCADHLHTASSQMKVPLANAVQGSTATRSPVVSALLTNALPATRAMSPRFASTAAVKNDARE